MFYQDLTNFVISSNFSSGIDMVLLTVSTEIPKHTTEGVMKVVLVYSHLFPDLADEVELKKNNYMIAILLKACQHTKDHLCSS